MKDIDAIVERFMEAEDANFSLFNYVNEVNAEVEKLEEQIADIKVGPALCVCVSPLLGQKGVGTISVTFKVVDTKLRRFWERGRIVVTPQIADIKLRPTLCVCSSFFLSRTAWENHDLSSFHAERPDFSVYLLCPFYGERRVFVTFKMCSAFKPIIY